MAGARSDGQARRFFCGNTGVVGRRRALWQGVGDYAS